MGPGDVALTLAEAPRALPRPMPAGGGASSPIPSPPVAWFAVVPMVFLGVFFAWPLLHVLVRGLSWDALAVLIRPATVDVVWFTVVQAVLSTVLTVLLGVPAAYALHRLRFRGRRALLSLLTVPFVLPTVVVGAAFRSLLPQQWVGGLAAIVLAHVFFNLAVVIRVVGGLWTHLDDRYEQAARTLGASPWTVARTITWPLLRPAVLAASALVFLFTFTSFGVVLVLGGPTTTTLEVEIYRRTVTLFDLSGAAALCLLQIAAVAVVLLVSGRLQRRLTVRQRLARAEVAAHRPCSALDRSLVAVVVVESVLVALPLLALVHDSLRVGERWGLDWWRSIWTDGPTTRDVAAWESIRVSVQYAAATTLIAVLVGASAACAIVYARRGGGALDTASALPLGTSAVTVGFGLLITFAVAPLDLRGSWIIVPIGQSLVAVPLVIRTVLPVLRSLDPRLREVAATLGSSPWRTWRTVDVAVLRRSLGAAAGLAAAVSLGEFGATSFLARTDAPTVPVLIGRLLSRPGEANVGQAAALSVLLVAVTALVVLATDHLRGSRGAEL